MPDTEHYVTLHDIAFMPIGLNLYRSLLRHQASAHLTVVCMDTETYEVYQRLQLPSLTAVSSEEWLDDKLVAIKASRNRREFCWTMASHSYDVAWGRHPDAARLTYLDADLYFFDSPAPLIEEMLRANKQILITEHAFDPRYEQSKTTGIYCVQFVTFSKSPESIRVLRDWQKLCAETCTEKQDGRTFGDQMYLDTWPHDYAEVVHVSQMKDRMLAPWNVDYFLRQKASTPIFYHFHGLRLLSAYRALAWENYRIGSEGRKLYKIYLADLSSSLECLTRFGYAMLPLPPGGSLRRRVSSAIRRMLNLHGQRAYMTISGNVSSF